MPLLQVSSGPRLRGNRDCTYAFRQLLLDDLSAGGFNVQAPPFIKGIAEEERAVLDGGDVLGLLPWVLDVSVRHKLDLSLAQANARRSADRVGTELHGAVHARDHRPVNESYVVMPWSAFVTVLRQQVRTP